MRRLILMLVLMFGFGALAHAAIDAYDFKSPQEEARFNRLTEEFRCPKCQNSNLAGSGAPIAKDLKDRIYQLMQEGKSDDEIKTYLVARYGDFISYKPPFRRGTLLLWLGPFSLLVFVALILVLRVRHRAEPAKPITEEERRRLEELLKNADRQS